MPRFLIHLFLSSALLASACGPMGAQKAPPPGPSFSTTPPASAMAPTLPPPPTPAKQQELAMRIPANATPVKIALLLPLAGESQQLGQSMLDAAALALYDQYFPLDPATIRVNLILIPKDTSASPAIAAQAAEEAIRQGASLIIGPVYSNGVATVAPVAKKAGVPVISLSNNRAVASPGAFVFGFLPEQQIVRIADYATLKNISSAGALLPNDAYGTAVAEAMKPSFTSRGIRVEPIEYYAPIPANLEAAVKRLKEGYDRQPFQALFIAEGGERLKLITDTLKAAGFDRSKVRYLGTGQWDDAGALKNPDMQGAWFATGEGSYQANFERRFMATYGYKPQRLASLAYDAVSLAAALSLSSGSAQFSVADLTAGGGFIGPGNGLYRLTNDGANERALGIMEIQPSGFKVLDAAPKNF